MHVFMLILSIAGQPEYADALCATRQECVEMGEQEKAKYLESPDAADDDFTYHVDYVFVTSAGKESIM